MEEKINDIFFVVQNVNKVEIIVAEAYFCLATLTDFDRIHVVDLNVTPRFFIDRQSDKSEIALFIDVECPEEFIDPAKHNTVNMHDEGDLVPLQWRTVFRLIHPGANERAKFMILMEELMGHRQQVSLMKESFAAEAGRGIVIAALSKLLSYAYIQERIYALELMVDATIAYPTDSNNINSVMVINTPHLNIPERTQTDNMMLMRIVPPISYGKTRVSSYQAVVMASNAHTSICTHVSHKVGMMALFSDRIERPVYENGHSLVIRVPHQQPFDFYRITADLFSCFDEFKKDALDTETDEGPYASTVKALGYEPTMQLLELVCTIGGTVERKLHRLEAGSLLNPNQTRELREYILSPASIRQLIDDITAAGALSQDRISEYVNMHFTIITERLFDIHVTFS